MTEYWQFNAWIVDKSAMSLYFVQNLFGRHGRHVGVVVFRYLMEQNRYYYVYRYMHLVSY